MEFLASLLAGIAIGIVGIYVSKHLTIQKQHQAIVGYTRNDEGKLLQKRFIVVWWRGQHILTLNLWKEYVE